MRWKRTTGFSLTEVLLAVATLTIGMVFIGGTYFVGVHFSARSFEKGLGSVVAREALNMIRLHGVNSKGVPIDGAVSFASVSATPLNFVDDFVYEHNSQFRWDAVLQRINGSANLYGVTVFVSRWNRDETYPPLFESRTVTVKGGRFIDGTDGSGESYGLSHGQWVADAANRNRVFRVMRSQGGGWELTPDPSNGSTTLTDYDLELWSLFPNPKGLSGIQSRVVYVLRDEIRLATE